MIVTKNRGGYGGDESCESCGCDWRGLGFSWGGLGCDWCGWRAGESERRAARVNESFEWIREYSCDMLLKGRRGIVSSGGYW